MISIQYLEYTPDLRHLSPAETAARLRAAAQIIPLTHLLIGWDVPEALLQACCQEASDLGLAFYRWQPLLTGDGSLLPQPGWQVIGLDGSPVAGFQNFPEFTFMCPNRPAVQEAVEAHIRRLAGSGAYEGLFLDRMRFPSPAGGLPNQLACFCPDCVRAAVQAGIDLLQVQSWLKDFISTAEGKADLVRSLLGAPTEAEAAPLRAFLDFRCQSITRFVERTAGLARSCGLQIGLDCFSPCLAMMVGQDLHALSRLGDWVKIMSYAHTLGPAGLPFEFLGLLRWLAAAGLSQAQASRLMGQACGLPFPADEQALERDGFSPQALKIEARRGLQECRAPVLLGLALVELPGPARLRAEQITADLQAIAGQPGLGLALSWDLRLIPLERLQLVAEHLPL